MTKTLCISQAHAPCSHRQSPFWIRCAESEKRMKTNQMFDVSVDQAQNISPHTTDIGFDSAKCSDSSVFGMKVCIQTAHLYFFFFFFFPLLLDFNKGKRKTIHTNVSPCCCFKIGFNNSNNKERNDNVPSEMEWKDPKNRQTLQRTKEMERSWMRSTRKIRLKWTTEAETRNGTIFSSSIISQHIFDA